MFNLEAISTSNLITVIQALIVLGGFFFSWKSLNAAKESLDATKRSIEIASNNLSLAGASVDTASKSLQLATGNAQTQLYNNMLMQGRDLQIKFIEMFVEDQDKARSFSGVVIGYYAGCFELRRLLSLPPAVTKLLDNDIKEAMRDKNFRKRWEELRIFYSKEFGSYVDSLKGV